MKTHSDLGIQEVHSGYPANVPPNMPRLLSIPVCLLIAGLLFACSSSKQAAPNGSQQKNQSTAPQQNATASSYGGVADGTSASGFHHPLRAIDGAVHRVDNKIRSSIRPDANDGMEPVYFGS